MDQPGHTIVRRMLIAHPLTLIVLPFEYGVTVLGELNSLSANRRQWSACDRRRRRTESIQCNSSRNRHRLHSLRARLLCQGRPRIPGPARRRTPTFIQRMCLAGWFASSCFSASCCAFISASPSAMRRGRTRFGTRIRSCCGTPPSRTSPPTARCAASSPGLAC
jgi:hypothetical protein